VDPHERADFHAYVVARSTALLRTAYLLTGDRGDAEDLLQTALARLAVSWHRVQAREALDAYVRRTMVHQQISHWRRRRVPSVSVADVPETTSSGSIPGPETRLVLWTALQRLPARQRAAVVLRFWEDLSETETAAVLGCAVGTVKSQTSRALAKLRADTGLRDLAPTEMST